MKFRTAPLLALTCIASGALADVITMPTTLTVATCASSGVYAAPNNWSISFTFDGDLSASGLNSDFGGWKLTVRNLTTNQTWTQESVGEDYGSWTRVDANARILKVGFAPEASTESGSIVAVPTALEIRYTTRRVGGTWESLGDALSYSSTASGTQQGELRVLYSEGGSQGQIWGTFAIPAPGAAALIGLAGLITSRRRS